MEPVTTTATTAFTISYTKLIINGLLAVLGGIVRLLAASKDTEGNMHKPTLWNFIGSVTCAGFTGILVYFLCESFNLSSELTAAVVGCSGYIGPVIIDVSFAKLQKYVDKKIENI